MTTTDDNSRAHASTHARAKADPDAGSARSVVVVVDSHTQMGGARTGPDDALGMEEKFVAQWNDLACQYGLLAVEALTAERRQAIQDLGDAHGPDLLGRAIAAIPDQPFLCGRGSRGWKITFDYLLRPEKCVQVAETAYSPHIVDGPPTRRKNEKQVGRHELDSRCTEVDHPTVLREIYEILCTELGRWPTERQLHAAYRERARQLRPSAPETASAVTEAEADRSPDNAADDGIRARAWWVGLSRAMRSTMASCVMGSVEQGDDVDLGDDSAFSVPAHRIATARSRQFQGEKARAGPKPKTRIDLDVTDDMRAAALVWWCEQSMDERRAMMGRFGDRRGALDDESPWRWAMYRDNVLLAEGDA